jgi:predicted RNA-binding Zn ribbon-like protein
MNSSMSKQPTDFRSRLLAGDLALDFLNTRIRVGDELVDLLQADRDVLAWLKQAGLPAPGLNPRLESLPLLRAARVLRENIRSLVEKRKAGRRGDPSILNNFLRHAQSHPWLVWNKPDSLTIERLWAQGRPEAVLAPVAEAAAELIARADFNLVKRCEGEGCVLWFFDQTKSHHRRWCSMEICGNRYKVGAYRARRRNRRGSS